MMRATLKYCWLTCKHKWFMFCAGLRLRVPLWQLITHDLSKFSPAEAPHYGRQFFGDKNDPLGFSYAWNHHQKCNKHHWEYWVPETGHNRGGYKDRDPLPMPERYVREMVADWLGASRAYEGAAPKSLEEWKWFMSHWPTINQRMHQDTRRCVINVLKEIGL